MPQQVYNSPLFSDGYRPNLQCLPAWSQLSRRRKTGFVFLVFLVVLGWSQCLRGRSKYAAIARKHVDELFARQSSTLKQAKGRYKLKNDRDPPPGYHLFYEFAQQNGCLIDEYDKVHRDFEPFYQLAEHHPTFFPDMIDRAMRIADDDGGLCLTTFNIKNHKVTRGPHWAPIDWESLVNKMAPMLPDMGLIFNYQDEPRVLFNTRRPDAYEFALNKSDQNPFRQGPRPTKEYYEEDSHHQCLLPNSEKGFGNLTNDVNAFLLSSRSTQHTHDLYPILSSARLTSCFADIVVPSLYYLWVRHGFEDNVRWEDKKSQIYWRGSTSGGSLDRQTYHSFPRFRLIDKSLRQPDIIDAGITKLHNCDPDPNNPTHAVCPEEEIKAEYNVETPSQPLEEVYKYKYALDLDGNSFSQRYFSLLRSGSLVFKSSTFSEFFDDWLKPYVHYIPVLPDLSDLERKIMWAIENDDEARQIQANGLEYATRVLTEKQMDCYHLSVFLEHGRLQQQP
ncbi:glycosyl transferase family 90-domain-containing protein [Mycena leptocephala]|nr:glycosyl transferase family 90-domain-containing protein [Mycena leptocephala]